MSVSTNLVMCSLCEETRASCRGPSNHNSVALILPHKAMLGFNGGAIGADIYCDRRGIHARSIIDSHRNRLSSARPAASAHPTARHERNKRLWTLKQQQRKPR